MDQNTPCVNLQVSCSTVGHDDTPAPDELTLSITPRVMEQLEKMIAYEQQARALFLQQFPGGDHTWCSVELMFSGFTPTCLLDEEVSDAGDDDSEMDFDGGESSEFDMNIDCQCVRLHEHGVVLTANLNNASTRIESDEISHTLLQQKFQELRCLLRSQVTQQVVGDALDNAAGDGDHGHAPSRSANKGMTL